MKPYNKKLAVAIAVIFFGFSILFVINRNNDLNVSKKSLTQELPSVEGSKKQIIVLNVEPKESTGTSTDGLYVNNQYKFSIKYPLRLDDVCGGELWEYSELSSENYLSVGFGPRCSKSGGYFWGVFVYKNRDVEDIIKQIGSQFSDRKEVRKNIVINGESALLVTVTTSQLKGWVAKTIFIVKENAVIHIINGGTIISEFDDFYNSFTFSK